MTNKNMHWTDDSQEKPFPFLLKPVGKDYLWGGSRLKDDFAKEVPISPLAETWECSVHPDGPSMVASGRFCGKSLAEVILEHPEYMGGRYAGKKEFPVLIKLIDARESLSIQVHPDDDYAAKHENGALGKTEMWYVLDASENSEVILGFRRNIKKEHLKSILESGRIEQYLQKVKICKDDIFLVKAGTVHGIGAGSLIAEVQENSNITYRLYDYNRTSKDGKKRKLQVDKAVNVIRIEEDETTNQRMRVLKYSRGCAEELLCRCRYFQVGRLIVYTERHREMYQLETDCDSFQVLLCIGGCGTVFGESGHWVHFIKGDCIFVPAGSGLLRIHGRAQILKVTC